MSMPGKPANIEDISEDPVQTSGILYNSRNGNTRYFVTFCTVI